MHVQSNSALAPLNENTRLSISGNELPSSGNKADQHSPACLLYTSDAADE